MSKMRKLLAILLTFAMVLGMSITTFAADEESTDDLLNKITITGFATDETTQVNAYQFISLDENANNWIVAEWAADYVTLSGDSYTVNDPAALGKEASGTPYVQKVVAGGNGICEFDNVPVGAYVILATSSNENTVYSAMIANTYDKDAEYMGSKDVELVAKSDKYKVEKTATDDFVYVGQVVDFEVKTVFPSFLEANNAANTFKVYDIPKDLTIDTSSVVVTLGTERLTLGRDYTVAATVTRGEDTVDGLTVDFEGSIGTENANAGKVLVITYSGTVTGTTLDEHAYENAAYSNRNGEELGMDETEGFTGDLMVTKTDDAEEPVVLDGAKFEVYKGETKLGFVLVQTAEDEDEEGKDVAIYKYEKNADEEGYTTEIEATFGKVKVTGLDEGTYWFKETLAPEGYSINADGVTLELEPGDTVVDHLHDADTIKDTKLVSLPSTGGMGTTIFTIGGCAIMIAAAYLFFASRRKEEA